jgi:RNA polymerase sigma factor (sigma-70 family)
MEYREDSYYVDLVLNGQVDAFTHLINKHKEMVFSIARQITRSREDAEEIAQDVFLKAFQNLRNFRKAARFSTWLYRIAYNETISKTRKKVIRTVELEEEVTASVSEEEVRHETMGLDPAEQKLVVEKLLSRMPDEDRMLVTLFYLHENSISEISEITGMSGNNVKVRLHRIRKRIYKELNNILNKEFSSLKS